MTTIGVPEAYTQSYMKMVGFVQFQHFRLIFIYFCYILIANFVSYIVHMYTLFFGKQPEKVYVLYNFFFVLSFQFIFYYVCYVQIIDRPS